MSSADAARLIVEAGRAHAEAARTWQVVEQMGTRASQRAQDAARAALEAGAAAPALVAQGVPLAVITAAMAAMNVPSVKERPPE